MTKSQNDALLQKLKTRFDQHPARHDGLAWADVLSRLTASHQALDAVAQMEATGGEPDVVWPNAQTGGFTVCDCSAESPAGRRSLCYDRDGLESRKDNRPENSAVDVAAAMGIALLAETQYRALQTLGTFDLKTSSWVQTPAAVRQLGGALFCDRRYGQVFTYHNGAQSYYAARGFRGCILL